MHQKTWSQAFAAHLAQRGLNQLDAMLALRLAGIKVTQSSVSCWSRGAAYPREATRQRIAVWSGGKVDADLPATVEARAS